MKNQYEVRGGTTAIIVYYKGIRHEVLIDTVDLPRLTKINYSIRITYCNNGWRAASWKEKTATGKRKGVYLHRYLMNFPKGLFVDHRDGNTLNNTRENLRVVTNAENQQNRVRLPSNNTSGHIGVYWSAKQKKWLAGIKIHGIGIHLGTFANLIDAIAARKRAEKSYHPYGNVLREAA